MHDDAYISGRSENNITWVVHDDLGWKNQTTWYILQRHWLYKWFSQFHSCGTYLVLSWSHSIVASLRNTRTYARNEFGVAIISMLFLGVGKGECWHAIGQSYPWPSHGDQSGDIPRGGRSLSVVPRHADRLWICRNPHSQDHLWFVLGFF